MTLFDAMPVVYIAGPFRADTPWAIEQNIRRAECVGLEVAKRGAIPLIPHTMYRFFQDALDDAFWLHAGKRLLRDCDALFLCEGWEGSSGSRGELSVAETLHIPSFMSYYELGIWVAEWKRE